MGSPAVSANRDHARNGLDQNIYYGTEIYYLMGLPPLFMPPVIDPCWRAKTARPHAIRSGGRLRNAARFVLQAAKIIRRLLKEPARA